MKDSNIKHTSDTIDELVDRVAALEDELVLLRDELSERTEQRDTLLKQILEIHSVLTSGEEI